jgi:hypothetical protein
MRRQHHDSCSAVDKLQAQVTETANRLGFDCIKTNAIRSFWTKSQRGPTRKFAVDVSCLKLNPIQISAVS